MRASLTLECSCGNTMVYTVKNKYHEESHAVYVDLTESIYDDKFRAKPTPSGMWINCRKCDNGFELV